MIRRRILILVLLMAGVAGIWTLQHKQASTEVTPRPLLYLVADTQRELERIPLELTRVSVEEENEIGETLARSFGLIPANTKDQEINRIREYVNEVGQRVTSSVQRPGIHYRFHYNPSEGFVNAVALPGGQIVIGRGLLQLLESEDEFASVLGHEVAHVDRRHSIGRLQYELQSRKLGLGGLYRLASVGVALFQAGYTKEQEFEADREGLRLAVTAGYSSGGALEAMKRLDRLSRPASTPGVSPVEEIAKVPAQALQEYFRSHPPTRERLSALEAEIASNHWNPEQAQRSLAVRPIFLTDEGKEFDRRGFYDKAMERYREALAGDPKFARAMKELARSEWHTGDASAAANTAAGLLRISPEEPEVWSLLAAALAASDRRSAPDRYLVLDEELKGRVSPRTRTIVQAEQGGLDLLAGRPAALRRYDELLRSRLSAPTEAGVRARVAWWMYRANKPKESLQESDASRQRDPDNEQVLIERGWVLSEIGRQADALEAIEKVDLDDDGNALKAVVFWRLEKQDTASQFFRTAVGKNAVWMESRWVANSFNPLTAQVLAELRAAELARRKKESLRAVHAAGAPRSK